MKASKGMVLLGVVALVLAAAFLLAWVVPAAGEEQIGSRRYVEGSNTFEYNVYAYPSVKGQYFLFADSEIRVRIKNGKYVMYLLSSISDETERKIDFYFYNPNGGLIGTNLDTVSNLLYTIPHDGTNYEYLDLVIKNRSQENKDLRFWVYDPVEAIMATPSGGRRAATPGY